MNDTSVETNTSETTPVIRKLHSNNITWIDVHNPTREALGTLADEYRLHDLHIEECLSKSQLPQVETEQDYVFSLLHFPVHEPTKNKIETGQLGIFLDKDYLITVHSAPENDIADLFSACEKDENLRKQYFQKSAGFLLYQVIDNRLGDALTIVNAINRNLDAIEDQVFDNESSNAYEIGTLRRKILRMRRIIATLKETLGELATNIPGFAGENLERYYGINAKRAKKLWGTLEEAKETIEIYKDADFTTSTERTNEILAVLTIIFTIGIPATVVGTFYGMNIPLPGGIEVGPWTFFGPYTTLALVLAISVVSAILMYLYFKKKRWL